MLRREGGAGKGGVLRMKKAALVLRGGLLREMGRDGEGGMERSNERGVMKGKEKKPEEEGADPA